MILKEGNQWDRILKLWKTGFNQESKIMWIGIHMPTEIEGA
jgi:hypothetical protein